MNAWWWIYTFHSGPLFFFCAFCVLMFLVLVNEQKSPSLSSLKCLPLLLLLLLLLSLLFLLLLLFLLTRFALQRKLLVLDFCFLRTYNNSIYYFEINLVLPVSAYLTFSCKNIHLHFWIDLNVHETLKPLLNGFIQKHEAVQRKCLCKFLLKLYQWDQLQNASILSFIIFLFYLVSNLCLL